MKKITLLSLLILLASFSNLLAQSICPSLDEAENRKLSCRLEVYYQNGNILQLGSYKIGKPHGKWADYYPNGKSEIIRNYKDGKLNGESKYYYENRELKNIGNHKDDKQDGEWKYYYENGKPKSIENYKDGELINSTNYDEK